MVVFALSIRKSYEDEEKEKEEIIRQTGVK